MPGLTSPQERLEVATNRIRSLESVLLLILDATELMPDPDFRMRVAAHVREALGNPNQKALAAMREGRPPSVLIEDDTIG